MTDRRAESTESLRQRAEDKLRAFEAAPPETFSPEEVKQLFHELRVHQIELEMQNEELRQTQAQLDTARARYFDLYDLAPVGYLTINQQGLIQEANLTAATLLGAGRITLLRQPFTRFILPEDQDIYYLQRKKVLKTGDSGSWEMRLLRADSSRFWAQLQAAPASKGELWLTLADISERKKAADDKSAFEQLFQQARKLESLRVLSGGIAHDFNNILAVITGNCFLARQNPAGAESRLSAIENAAERATILCRQMLTYAGNTSLELSRINMCTLAAETVKLLQSTISPNIELRLYLPQDILSVDGDLGLIRQLVMNLVNNAAEALGEDQGEVSVTLQETVFAVESAEDYFGRPIPAGCYSCLEVADNGCGMDEETIKKTFEPFYSTKFTGRGLGLAATLGIITAHRGALQLFSQPGRGTTFKVFLPVAA